MTPSPASPALDAKGLSKERLRLDVRSFSAATDDECTLRVTFGAQVSDADRSALLAAINSFNAARERAEPNRWHDVGYLMAVIDAAIEDGFDPDEDGPLLDEIRAELASGRTPPGPLDTPASSVVDEGMGQPVRDLIGAAKRVYDKLASETASVNILDQEALGVALAALTNQHPHAAKTP